MNVIFKYHIELVDTQEIEMHKDANILSVQVQNDIVYIWALVDTRKEEVPVRFNVVGTGNPIPLSLGADLEFIGTVQKEPFVWHIFKNNV